MDVGFVGLGTMGLPMALRVVGAGHAVHVATRSAPPLRRAVEAGALACPDPAEVVRRSEVTVLCLPDDQVVRQVVRGVLADVADRVLVDCSTVGPDTERDLADQVAAAGGAYLDAPVSGGPGGAAAGTLAVMVGGDAAALHRARPVLDAFAGYVDHVGPSGSGQVVKLCNQVLVCAQLVALGEVADLVARSGVGADRLHAALVRSTGDSAIARTRFPVPGVVPAAPASHGWRPDFTAALMRKDIALALAQAERVGAACDSARTALDRLDGLLATGDAGLDFSALARQAAAGAAAPPVAAPPDAAAHPDAPAHPDAVAPPDAVARPVTTGAAR